MIENIEKEIQINEENFDFIFNILKNFKDLEILIYFRKEKDQIF